MKKIIALFLAMILALIALPVAADTGLQPGTPAYVVADQLHLREYPQGPWHEQAPYGAQVTVLEGPDANGYYKISYHGAIYWVYGQYLTGTYIQLPPAAPRQRTVYEYGVVTDGGVWPLVFVSRPGMGPLALRSQPDKGATVLEWLPEGTPLLVISDYIPDGGGYWRVHTMDGLAGYAHGGSLKALPPEGAHYRSTAAEQVPDLTGSRFKYNLPVFLTSIQLVEDSE